MLSKHLSEVETYATNLWQDLQQAPEQDCLTEGHVQIERTVETIRIPSQNGTNETLGSTDYGFRRYLSGAVLGHRIEHVVLHDDAERFIVPALDINAAAHSIKQKGGRDDPDIPDPEAGSSEFSYKDYEEVPEPINEISEEVMEEQIFKRNLNFSFDYSRAPNEPGKEYNCLDSSEVQTQAAGDVQHRQEQEAQDYAVSERNEIEEEQNHKYRHGAEYWQSARLRSCHRLIA